MAATAIKILEMENYTIIKGGKSKSNDGRSSTEVYPFRSDNEIRMMLSEFDNRIMQAYTPTNIMIAKRNKMLFVVGINLSIRGSDLSDLRWSDLFIRNIDGGYEWKDGTRIQPVKTRRTGKYVTLAFNEAVKNIVNEYIMEYPIEDIDGYVFTSKKGDKLPRASIGRIIKDVAESIGIKQNINSHSLRKTFGYHVWHKSENKEKSLVMLQYIFGHNSITDTMKYIGIVDTDIYSVFNELNLSYQ